MGFPLCQTMKQPGIFQTLTGTHPISSPLLFPAYAQSYHPHCLASLLVFGNRSTSLWPPALVSIFSTDLCLIDWLDPRSVGSIPVGRVQKTSILHPTTFIHDIWFFRWVGQTIRPTGNTKHLFNRSASVSRVPITVGAMYRICTLRKRCSAQCCSWCRLIPSFSTSFHWACLPIMMSLLSFLYAAYLDSSRGGRVELSAARRVPRLRIMERTRKLVVTHEWSEPSLSK